jgi:hypothetical protein
MANVFQACLHLLLLYSTTFHDLKKFFLKRIIIKIIIGVIWLARSDSTFVQSYS